MCFDSYVLFQDAFTRAKKANDGTQFVPMQQNVKRVFSDEQEQLIEDYAIKIAKMFYGLSIPDFRKLVFKYAEACGSKAIPNVWWKEGMATRDWYYGYMDRHPKLALKAPEGMSIARAIAFNRTNVEAFFSVYTETMEMYQFTPDRIYNVDESGLSTVMKPMKVVCQRGQPVASQVARERGCHMTFVGFINAAGQTIPPVFIVARKKMNPDFLRGTTSGTTVLLQPSGWMDHERFLQTLKHLRERSYCSPENKILLIMDNAECHMSIHVVQYAIQNGIVIVTLPPHTTAKLQPLDVSVFGPFKSFMRALQNDFKLSNPHVPITEHVLPEMACKAWVQAATPANINSGFAATGIWPINRNIFPDDAFIGAEVSERSPPPDVAELPDLNVSATPSSSGEPSPDYQPEPQPGPSGIGRLELALAEGNPAPEQVKPFPKAPERSDGKRKQRPKVETCRLTDHERSINMLQEKEDKKLAKIAKKKQMEQRKIEREERKKQNEENKRKKSPKGPCKKKKKVVREEDTSEDEDLPAKLVDDSSEYSDEDFLEDEAYTSTTGGTYPFVEKELEVRELASIGYIYIFIFLFFI